MGLEALGGFHLAYSVGAVAMLGMLGLNNAWGPLVLGRSDEHRVAFTTESATLLIGIATAAALGINAMAPLAIGLVVPEDYGGDDLVQVVRFVAIAVVPMPIYLGSSHLLLARRQTVVVAVASAIGAVLNLSANLILVPVAGLVGAAIATVLAYLWWAISLGAVTTRRDAVRWNWPALVAGMTLSTGVVLISGDDGGLRAWSASTVAIAVVAAAAWGSFNRAGRSWGL